MLDLDPNAVSSIKTVTDPSALGVFKEDTSAAAILKRKTPRAVQEWIDQLPVDQLPFGRIIMRPGMVADAVTHLCDMVELPEGPNREWLQDDIAELADVFATLMEAPFLRLRLNAVNTNACRKFHMDYIYARLICTYRGTGTQYGISPNGSEPPQIFTVDTGSPILLRGKLWPEEPEVGLLHRSPPIEGTGETRLVLVLDPIFDPDEEV